MLLALFDPGREAVEAGSVGDVIDKDNSVHVAVVVLHHGLPETLLACSVPQLDLDIFAVNLDQSLPEVHTDRGLGLLGELAGTKAVSETGLPDPGVPDHDDFEDAGPGRWKTGARQGAGEFS